MQVDEVEVTTAVEVEELPREFLFPLTPVDVEFTKRFAKNPFGYTCSICDRLWFLNDLFPIPINKINDDFKVLLTDTFANENVLQLKLCSTCTQSVKKAQIPRLSKSNGFWYPLYPDHLPPLDPTTARLVSLRFPFMQIRTLRTGSKGIVGQAINIPVDVSTEVSFLGSWKMIVLSM